MWGLRFVDVDGMLALRQVCRVYCEAVRHATVRMDWARWEAVTFDAAGDLTDEYHAPIMFYGVIPSNRRLRLAVDRERKNYNRVAQSPSDPRRPRSAQ